MRGALSHRRWMAVLWPAFLLAGVLEMVVFALVDPSAVHALGGGPAGLSATAVYSLAFGLFWAVMSVASALTLLLGASADEINRVA